MATREERLLPNGTPRYVRCYDNGGPDVGGSADRYTIVFTRCGGGLYISANREPFHPQGIGQHGEGKQAGSSTIDRPTSSHLGKRIAFEKLPPDVRTLVETTYRDLWKVPKIFRLPNGEKFTKDKLEAMPFDVPFQGEADVVPGFTRNSHWDLFDVDGSGNGEYRDEVLERLGLVELGEPEIDNAPHESDEDFKDPTIEASCECCRRVEAGEVKLDDWDAALAHLNAGGMLVKIKDSPRSKYYRFFAVELAK